MRSDYRRHGFVPDDLPFVKRFEHIARTRWGWDDARIQDAYAWYRAAPVNQPRERLLADFYQHAERKGWPMHEADLAVAWHDNVEADGIESFALPEPPVRDDDARRRAEILHTLQTDSRRYFSDEAMQNELYEINARLGGETTDFVPRIDGDNAARKTEIQDAMREGRSGPYWRPGSTMPDEYRAILQRESEPATQDATQTPAAPANTETAS
jgi:hypothetical protein